MSSNIALGNTRKITYTITNKNRSGTIIIPQFTATSYMFVAKQDATYDGDARLENQGEDNSWNVVNFVFSSGVHVFTNELRTLPAGAEGTPVVTSGDSKTKYPFQLRLKVASGPTTGEAKIIIVYTE